MVITVLFLEWVNVSEGLLHINLSLVTMVFCFEFINIIERDDSEKSVKSEDC